MEVLIRNCHLLQALVANLWTESTAQRRYWLIANVKKPQNPNKLVVAATCEIAKT